MAETPHQGQNLIESEVGGQTAALLWSGQSLKRCDYVFSPSFVVEVGQSAANFSWRHGP